MYKLRVYRFNVLWWVELWEDGVFIYTFISEDKSDAIAQAEAYMEGRM